MKKNSTIYMAIIICSLQMIAYAWWPLEWNVFLPIGNNDFWIGFAITHSYHYVDKFSLKSIDVYLIIFLMLQIFKKITNNIHIHSVSSILMAWFPGAFANFIQILLLGKVDNLMAFFIGKSDLSIYQSNINTLAVTFSIGDVWVVLANIYFVICVFKNRATVKNGDFKNYILANKFFK